MINLPNIKENEDIIKLITQNGDVIITEKNGNYIVMTISEYEKQEELNKARIAVKKSKEDFENGRYMSIEEAFRRLDDKYAI